MGFCSSLWIVTLWRDRGADIKRRGTEGGDTGERENQPALTETINKLSSQSISYVVASVIALGQSRLCAAWECARGDVMVKYEAGAARGLTLIVTFVTEGTRSVVERFNVKAVISCVSCGLNESKSCDIYVLGSFTLLLQSL